jgi:hypothetical protein
MVAAWTPKELFMNDGRTIAKLGAPIDDAAKVNEIVQDWGL